MSDQPSPSTRISEERLRDMADASAGHWSGLTTTELVAEIRRYRAMLLGLAESGALNGETCRSCGVWIDLGDSHKEGCALGSAVSEVEAIRAERPKAPTP